jgi:regulatory protein
VTATELSRELMSQAVRILSRRAHSRGELKRKLARYAEPDLIDPILDRLEELKLLNDADYAYNFASYRMKQDGWGPLKVLQSLRKHDVPSELAEESITRIRNEAGDLDLLQEYLRRHCRKAGLPQNRKSLQRLVSHLRRRGFQEETIYGVLRHLIRTAAWQHFETGE